LEPKTVKGAITEPKQELGIDEEKEPTKIWASSTC
jgi:hypothetical protein